MQWRLSRLEFRNASQQWNSCRLTFEIKTNTPPKSHLQENLPNCNVTSPVNSSLMLCITNLRILHNFAPHSFWGQKRSFISKGAGGSAQTVKCYIFFLYFAPSPNWLSGVGASLRDAIASNIGGGVRWLFSQMTTFGHEMYGFGHEMVAFGYKMYSFGWLLIVGKKVPGQLSIELLNLLY